MLNEQFSFKVLVVDDEPAARRGVRRLLSGEADFVVVGECGAGIEAVAAIRDLEPDLVFLDVQMPEMDGFGVVEAVGIERFPALIFVTAYDEFAVRAFDFHALDYLLKPINPERFKRSLARVRHQLRAGPTGQVQQRLLGLIQQFNRPGWLERLAVKLSDRIVLIEVENIDWIEAADNYVCVHLEGRSYMLHETLSALEKKLDPNSFRRIHRSRMVNLKKIKELHPLFHGEYVIVLKNGAKLTSGRRYRDSLQSLLENCRRV
jgi:two-component system LytT family response regulator